MKGFDLVIVTPIYEDLEASSRLFQALANEFAKAVYIVAVDDGSLKQPLDIFAIKSTGLDGAVIRLKRNVGHQRAISIGLGYVAEHMDKSQKVIVMDSDGEDLPKTIMELTGALLKDSIDVAVAQRKSRVETVKFKSFYLVYKLIFRLLSGKQISFGNFMALKHTSIKRLVTMQELGIHLAGTILSSKLRIELVPIDRGPRYAGQSKMNFMGLVLHGFKGLMVFAEDVLVRVGIASAVVAAMAVIASIVAITLKALGFATPGWLSVSLGLLFLVFLQTATMTLMMLMLTGVVKNKGTDAQDYKIFIDEVIFD